MITDPRPVAQQPVPEPFIPSNLPRPQPPHGANSPPREQDPPQDLRETIPVATAQHITKPLTTHMIPDHYQLLRDRNHTRHIAPTWVFPMGTIAWKENLTGITAIDAIQGLTPDQTHLPPATHFFFSSQSTATFEGTSLAEQD